MSAAADPAPFVEALTGRGLEVRVFPAGELPEDLDGCRGVISLGGEAPELVAKARAAGLPVHEGHEGQDMDGFAERAANASTYRSAAGTREFFGARAATWEEKFPDDEPVYAAAIAEMRLPEGGAVLDAGCGTGRALPLLRDAVGANGRVIGIDLTPEMIASAEERGRGAYAELIIADTARLPLPDASLDGVFAAGLISHVPDRAALLTELARVTVPGGRLALFHPVGRAVLAARHGRTPGPDDVRAEHNLKPLLARTGWQLQSFEDRDDRYLALASRADG